MLHRVASLFLSFECKDTLKAFYLVVSLPNQAISLFLTPWLYLQAVASSTFPVKIGAL